MLAVLRRRDVDGRAVDVDKDGEDEGETMTATPVLVLGCVPEVGAVDDDLGPRREALRRLIWPAGTARLISCSGRARPGLLAWFGSGCGLEGGGSWRGPALAGLFGPLSLLLRGGRPSVWLSSVTSIIKLRLAMTGGNSLLEMEVRRQVGTAQPCWTAETSGERLQQSKGGGDKHQRDRVWVGCGESTYTHYTQYTQYTRGYSCRCRAEQERAEKVNSTKKRSDKERTARGGDRKQGSTGRER